MKANQDTQLIRQISKGLKERAQHHFSYRSYQQVLRDAMLVKGYKKAFSLWHRGAGKDLAQLNIAIELMKRKPGNYLYGFPTYAQGKKVLWDAMAGTGKKFLSYFPQHQIVRTVKDEMFMEWKSGTTFQIVGTENIDLLRGTGIDGFVESEAAFHGPHIMAVLEPAIRKKNGWLMLNTTPPTDGGKFVLDMWNMANTNENWFTQKLTIDDTYKDAKGEDGNRVVTDEDIEQLRQEGTSEEFIQREYYCSFECSTEGAYYADWMKRVINEQRITHVPYEPELPVITVWDIGMSRDGTAIWFIQLVNKEVRLIDFYQGGGEQFSFYAKLVKEKSYVYQEHLLPHDASVREMGAGSRYITLRSLGIHPITMLPKGEMNKAHANRVEAIRNILDRCWFDAQKTKVGVDALQDEHKKFNQRLGEYDAVRAPSWTNHACDAFGDFALWYFRRGRAQRTEISRYYTSNFSVFKRN